MQGAKHKLEFKFIGVNVHLPNVALKAYVGGSRGHCWVELRYLLRHFLYIVSTCRWVKARSDRFASSWSKRHMLTRADLRDAAKHCEYVRQPTTMPTQEYLVSTRFVFTLLLYLICQGRGARQPKVAAMLLRYSLRRSGKYQNGVCLTTMVHPPGVEPTSVELRASLADSWTSVVDGSVKVLRALGSSSKADGLVQFLKFCYEDEDGVVQNTTVAVSGKQMTVQTENVATLMPRLPSKKHFQRVDSGTKLESSIGAIPQKRPKAITSFVQARRGGSAIVGFADSSCRNVMAEVVANSVTWSRRTFVSPAARRICISADEFNRESSRMILICRDMCSNVLGYLPLQVMPNRVEKRAMVFFCFAPFFDHFTPFFDQNAKTTFLIKKVPF